MGSKMVAVDKDRAEHLDKEQRKREEDAKQEGKKPESFRSTVL